MEENTRFTFMAIFVIAAFSWPSFLLGTIWGQHLQTNTICEAECGHRWTLEESRCVCLVPREESDYSK